METVFVIALLILLFSACVAALSVVVLFWITLYEEIRGFFKKKRSWKTPQV